MILADTIISRIEKETKRNILYEFDVRYLSIWYNKYPNIFPKFVKEGNYNTIYDSNKMRWKIVKKKDI